MIHVLALLAAGAFVGFLFGLLVGLVAVAGSSVQREEAERDKRRALVDRLEPLVLQVRDAIARGEPSQAIPEALETLAAERRALPPRAASR